MSKSLLPVLQEVIAASCEDATHESTPQVANLGLSQGSWSSSQAPPRAKGSQHSVPQGCGSHAAGSHSSGQWQLSCRQGNSSTSGSRSCQNWHCCHTHGHRHGGASGSAVSSWLLQQSEATVSLTSGSAVHQRPVVCRPGSLWGGGECPALFRQAWQDITITPD